MLPSFILRRILLMIPTVIAITIFVFVLITLPPGDFLQSHVAELEAQGMEVAQEQIEILERRYGLDRPLYERYFRWVSGFPYGDFGLSFMYDQSVLHVILQYLPYTVLLALATELFIIVVGIPIGIYSACNQYTLGDYFFTLAGFIGISIPNFLLALTLMFVSFVYFEVPTLGGLFSEEFIDAPWSMARVIDLLRHLWIPVVVLGTAGTAGIIRVMRGNLLDVLNLQYIYTARAKGLKEMIVVYKHAVRNALHPVIMNLGMRLPQLLSGAAIVSIVLSLPTLGPVLLDALIMQDMYLAGTILLFECMLLLIGNLFADIALAMTDPRVRYE